MRFLALTVPLLLLASPLLGVPVLPTEFPNQSTSIETVTDIVEMTRILTVTEPSVAITQEPLTHLTYEEAVAKLAEIQLKLDEAKKVVDELEHGKAVTSSPHGPNEVPEIAADPAVVTPANLTMCSCKVADECRKESMNEMDTCMTECNDKIESYGSKKDDYQKCFTKFNATIVEAENCLFEKKEDYCGDDAKEIETNWDELTNIQYSPANTEVKETDVWAKHAPKYTKMQEFFHCTKNCIHTKLSECSAKKNCAVKMPTPEVFEEKMKKCTQDNQKISTAILQTCQCLAWQQDVKELQYSCVFLGNKYYTDKA